ncbi:MAG: hypothetical protein R3B09_22070 [Nannocystaceae bacterium]
MRAISSTIVLSITLAFGLGACGGTSGMFKGKGTGQPRDPANVRVVHSKDDLKESYKELGVARAKAATAQEAVDLAKQQCARGGGGDLLIMNTEPFQSGDVWRVDATCGLSESAAPAQGGGGKASGTGKPL